MERFIKPIGGEFWYEDYDNVVADRIEDGMLLDGGLSSIEVILETLQLRSDESILLPGYLCPTIVADIRRITNNIVFYGITEEFDLDCRDIRNKIMKYNVKAIFFIDYFGFFHKQETLIFLKEIQKKGIILIEDAVQLLWKTPQKEFIGDYLFNSYRKFLPIDGSILYGVQNKIKVEQTKSAYAKCKEHARILKTNYLKNGEGSEEKYLEAFEDAESLYYEDRKSRIMTSQCKHKLEKYNFDSIWEKRNSNFKYLEKMIGYMKNITPLFMSKEIKSVILCYPILVEKRDALKKYLAQNSIYCPVHWKLDEDWVKEFPNIQKISQHILSIPIDQRYDQKDMKRISEVIYSFYNSEEKNV